MVYRDGTTYATQGGLVRVAGYKESGAFTSTATIADTSTAGAVTQDVGKPTYDIGGSACTNQEKYQTKFFKVVRCTPSDLGGSPESVFRGELKGVEPYKGWQRAL